LEAIIDIVKKRYIISRLQAPKICAKDFKFLSRC